MTSTTEFIVVGEEKLHCEGCERRVDRALTRLGGVREVEASYRTQRVAVEYNPGQIGEGEIGERLELLGYEVEPRGNGS